MKKILLHLSDENSYKSFIRSLIKNNNDENLQLIGNSLHNVLFDTHHKTKPDIFILPSNEYTQEFHDYITEYHNNTKIFIFANNLVVNTKIINFWNSANITVISKAEWFPEQSPEKCLSYESLYDDDIYKNLNKPRNNKIAVYLSSDDEKNNSLLYEVLYPKTNLPLVLFNSPTFKNNQNVGMLTSEDSCRVLNTFSKLIDIDNRFYLEASACGIDILENGENIKEIINNNILKQIKPYENKSYSSFVKETFLPTL